MDLPDPTGAGAAVNPLLDQGDLPKFDQIRPAHIAPALDELLARARDALEAVVQPAFPANWNAISQVLDVTTERLGCAWSMVSHLNSVADTAELRAAYNEALPKVTEFMTALGADERLYEKYKAIDPAALDSAQQQALKNTLRNFVLGGAELKGAQRVRYAEIQERLAALGQKFSENTLDATDAFSLYVDESQIGGVPDDVRQTAAAAAQAQGRSGFKLTLQMPCYMPVMQFAQSSPLREEMYRAYVARASDQSDAEQQQFDNTSNIGAILALRNEEARLLGYSTYGELSLVPKMASSPQAVLDFLRNLAVKARPFALKDLDELRAFARERLDIADPQAWDWPFISEKLKEHRYAFSEQEVKQYFTAAKVLSGLFKIVETLFDVCISPDTAPVWNDQVRFYRIERRQNQTLELLGQFYLDLPARNGKRSGAWMDDVRGRWKRPDTGALQTPVAHLVCNFAQGQNGKDALLTHDDVITLFHEFGHGLQHLLTQVNERDVSGISGVEWDAVELPSQFMENFCWEWNVLKHMTAHAETGEPLPRALFDKMIRAKNFQSGLQTLRQVEFALFDMLLHTQREPDVDFMSLLQEVRREVAVLVAPDWARPAHTFGHIFSGGYAAGYYSYKWAEVLSADAYAAFEETALPGGLPNPQTGTKYRQAILEAGGSRPALELFKAFRGREPSMDALLRHQGMTTGIQA